MNNMQNEAKQVYDTIQARAVKREGKANRPVSVQGLRGCHSELGFGTLGKALDRLLEQGEIYEVAPGKVCHI